LPGGFVVSIFRYSHKSLTASLSIYFSCDWMKIDSP
jgi:hypothetical protein